MTDHRRRCHPSQPTDRTSERRQHAPADAAPELFERPRDTVNRRTTDREQRASEERTNATQEGR